ncbi:MAG TPA: hypothetical protein VFX96_02495 [Pyrinomonadaceae bacterium]|nr:hypothetical protein [Pyrinomonadaceae bacterium]
MNDNSAQVELFFVLAAMAVLLLFAVAAVVIFFRIWNKERRK